jgi:methylated-DNA-[protein]-cysteine S-methyltransferase
VRAAVDSPLGPVWVEAEGDAIVASGWGKAEPATEGSLLAEALDQLAAYFDGSRQGFDLPLAHGRSGLQADVLAALLTIPRGETRT